MISKEENITLLDQSIKHWEYLSESIENFKDHDCCLCKEYTSINCLLPHEQQKCPIYIVTKINGCQDSPYGPILYAAENDNEDGYFERCKAMIKFLKDVKKKYIELH